METEPVPAGVSRRDERARLCTPLLIPGAETARPPRGAVPQPGRARAQQPAGPRRPLHCSCAGRACGRACMRVRVCTRVCVCARRLPAAAPQVARGCSAPPPPLPATTPPALPPPHACLQLAAADGKFAQQPWGREGMRHGTAEAGGGRRGGSDNRATAASSPTQSSLPGHTVGQRPRDPPPSRRPSCPLCSGWMATLAQQLRSCSAHRPCYLSGW